MSVSPDRRLTEGEQLVLAAMQSADDAIVTMALDGTITHWNRAAEQLFGYSAREAIGTNIGIIVPGDRKGEMLGELARIARGERVHHYETVRVAKDGRSIGVSLRFLRSARRREPSWARPRLLATSRKGKARRRLFRGEITMDSTVSAHFSRRCHTYFYELECAASPLILLCLSAPQRIQA